MDRAAPEPGGFVIMYREGVMCWFGSQQRRLGSPSGPCSQLRSGQPELRVSKQFGAITSQERIVAGQQTSASLMLDTMT